MNGIVLQLTEIIDEFQLKDYSQLIGIQDHYQINGQIKKLLVI